MDPEKVEENGGNSAGPIGCLCQAGEKHIRVCCASVWHSSITGEQRLDLERIQKLAFHIILGELYVSALKLLSMETLNTRRIKLCKKFVIKSVKKDKFNRWFKINNNLPFTRRKQPKYCEVLSRTDRYKKSPISYLTKILNGI